MTTTFETAKVGDKVWCMMSGWGEIRGIDSSKDYPIAVYFAGDDFKTYTVDGLYEADNLNRTLFWDEVVIDAPVKPMPDLQVDAKVLVWNNSKAHAHNAHFCCFEGGKIYTYESGRTSFTKALGDNLNGWNYWELAE